MSPLRLDPVAARRFMRRAVLLDTPANDVATAISHHGYIQIDPINVCGRMHDLILRNRVAGYTEGALMRHLHGDGTRLPAAARTAFEHHIPSTGILVAFPVDAWPHLRVEMRRRTQRTGAWSGRLTPKQEALVPRLLAEITARGPLSSEDFADTGRARSVWGAATMAKATLQKLFFHGELLIARRGESNRRYYDLPDRVLPPSVLGLPSPTIKETARWEALLKVRQRRLVMLKRGELPHVADLVQSIAVEGCPTLYCLKSDLPLLEARHSETKNQTAACLGAITKVRPYRHPEPCEGSSSTIAGEHHAGSFTSFRMTSRRSHRQRSEEPKVSPILLAPLDPLIYDRRVTSCLWNFKYTWEVYVPPGKRVRGYYALPLLVGTELVGHIDPKADRASRRLRVVRRFVRRGHKVADAVRAFARWLGLR